MKAVKNPIAVDVWQAEDLYLTNDIPDWLADYIYQDNFGNFFGGGFGRGYDFFINTFEEGMLLLNKGDYVLHGKHGEIWPVRKDIFEATYTILEED